MKKETLDKGLDLLRQIDRLEYLIKDLEKTKKYYSEKGYLKLDSESFDKIQIPFEVFKLWFDEEIIVHLDKISSLNKELEEL